MLSLYVHDNYNYSEGQSIKGLNYAENKLILINQMDLHPLTEKERQRQMRAGQRKSIKMQFMYLSNSL